MRGLFDLRQGGHHLSQSSSLTLNPRLYASTVIACGNASGREYTQVALAVGMHESEVKQANGGICNPGV